MVAQTQKNITMDYNVIEDRGYGIKYPYQYDLTFNEAKKLADKMNYRAEQLREEGLQNGSGYPYHYTVE